MVTLKIYLNNGNQYAYEVATDEKAREHVKRIMAEGYLMWDKENAHLDAYPPHQIYKVTADPFNGGHYASIPIN